MIFSHNARLPMGAVYDLVLILINGGGSEKTKAH